MSVARVIHSRVRKFVDGDQKLRLAVGSNVREFVRRLGNIQVATVHPWRLALIGMCLRRRLHRIHQQLLG